MRQHCRGKASLALLQRHTFLLLHTILEQLELVYLTYLLLSAAYFLHFLLDL